MSKYATLSEQIYDELYRDITDQTLKCGQKLTLRMLKQRFNVSHTPIREALRRLSENGLVTYYSNCGVTVTEFTETDIREIFQFIGELDAMAIQFCKNSFTQEPLIHELNEIIETSNKLIKEGKYNEWKDYSEKFHIAFYRHGNNQYLDDAARKIRAKIEVLSCIYYKPQNIEKINNSHQLIFNAVHDHDFDKASNLMRSHLQYDLVFALTAHNERKNQVR